MYWTGKGSWETADRKQKEKERSNCFILQEANGGVNKAAKILSGIWDLNAAIKALNKYGGVNVAVTTIVEQEHVHEMQGSVEIAEREEDPP